MKNSDKTLLKLSELRESLANGIQTEEAEKAGKEIARLEALFRTQKEAEAREEEGEENSETREFARLTAELRCGEYLTCALSGRQPQGKEAEFNQEKRLEPREGGVMIPWEALAPVEQRADAASGAPSSAAANSHFLGRVFANSEAMFLGMDFVEAGIGDYVHTIITAGASPAPTAIGTDKDAEAVTWDTVALAPSSIRARYLFGGDAVHRHPGFEEALRMDLSGAIAEDLDKEVIVGGTAPKFPEGLLNVLGANASTSAETMATYIAHALEGVDGRNALMSSHVRFLIGSATLTDMSSLTNGTGSDRRTNDYLEQILGVQLHVSPHIAAPASNIQQSIRATVRPGIATGVIATWGGGVEFVRDPYSNAPAGQIALTAILYANARVRDASFKKIGFKHA